jgi:hypothetical protein
MPSFFIKIYISKIERSGIDIDDYKQLVTEEILEAIESKLRTFERKPEIYIAIVKKLRENLNLTVKIGICNRVDKGV